jgi:hypothetical protein
MALAPDIAAALANPCPPDEPPVEFAVVQVREQRRRVRRDRDGSEIEVRPRVAIGTVHKTIVLPPKNCYSPDRAHALVEADGARAGDIMAVEKIAASIPDRELARLDRRKDADPEAKAVLDAVARVRAVPAPPVAPARGRP